MKLIKLLILSIILISTCFVFSCKEKNDSYIFNTSIEEYNIMYTQYIPRGTIIIKGIDAFTYQANYIRRDLITGTAKDYDNVIMVTVSVYNTTENIETKLIDSLEKNLYEINKTTYQGQNIYKITNLDSIWYLWNNNNKAILIAFTDKDMPKAIIDKYLKKYPSTI